MSEPTLRYSMLERYFQQFLSDEDSASFIRQTSESYTIGTLEKLAHVGGRITRRASILAIGFLGDFHQNETMGQALVDPDRGVRLLADHNIRRIWQRQGNFDMHSKMSRLDWLNSSGQFTEVIELASTLLDRDPALGEAWNQRAIAYAHMGEFELAVSDCQETLNCNRYHFPAAMGMGHCCLELDDGFAALECFRLAIHINPDLAHLRGQIRHLEEMMEACIAFYNRYVSKV